MGILYALLVGALSGFIAGKLTRGEGFGFWVNFFVGLVGGAIGGWLLPKLGIFGGNESIIRDIVMSVIGAVIFLWILSLFRRKK